MAELQTAPKPIDWDLIQARYIQGVGPTELARMFNVKADTISVRATRKGWQRLKQKPSTACQSVAITVQEKPEENRELAKQSERARNALGDVIARSAEHLAQMPIVTGARALRLNQDAESLVRNAKTVFGWSEGQSQPSVRINVLSSFTVEPQVEPQVHTQPVIECESTPVLPPPSE